MKKFMRVTSIILILTFFVSFSGFDNIVIAASENEHLTLNNDFVKIKVNKNNGRFGITTVKDEAILFERDESETSFTTFRIDGNDYIFGNDYGFMGLDGGVAKESKKSGLSSITEWEVDDIKVLQQLTLVSDEDNPLIGNVKVRYTVTNESDAAKDIGARVLFDTMTGDNDGSSIIVPGVDDPVKKEKRFEGEEIPLYWQSQESDIKPDVISYGLLGGWGNTPPDEMVAAHWNGISSTKWDYEIDESLKFTSQFNRYKNGDSAVALYWNPLVIESGDSVIYETYYGLGVFDKSGEDTFNASVKGPDSLELNNSKTDFTPEKFEVSLEIDNTLPQSLGMTGLNVDIELAQGLELTEGQQKTKSKDVVHRNRTESFTWELKAAEVPDEYRIAQVTVFLNSDSLEEPMGFNKYIIIPGKMGDIPELQYTSITPQKLFHMDDKKSFKIYGSGFELLEDRDKWRLEITKSDDTPIVYDVKHSSINVIDDSTLQISITDINELGSYNVKITHNEFGSHVFQNGLEITDDEAYKNRSYDILVITEDTTSGQKMHEIHACQSEEEIEMISHLKEKLLTIRGDIRETDDGSYEVYGDSYAVEMNSILLYESDVPMTVTEENGTVNVTGSGDLSVKNSIAFWKWDFYMLFSGGVDYTITPLVKSEKMKKKVEIVFSGAAGTLRNMLSGFNVEFDNAYFNKDEDGYGLIFGGSLFLSLGGKEKESDDSDSGSTSGGNTGGDSSGNDKKTEMSSPFKIEANVDRVDIGQKENDEIGLRGLKADTTVGFPKDFFPPPVDIGAEATLNVDTFKDPGEVGIKLDIDLKAVIIKGELEFVLIPYPIPDKLYFYLGTEVGVDIIPPIPVATLLGVGGGIDNLYSLISWDWNAPPLTVMLTVTVEAARILKANEVTLSVSWQHAEIKGDISIKSYDLIKDATIRVRWYEPFCLGISLKLEAFDCISGQGEIQVYEGYFMGVISANLHIPDWIPAVGGMILAGAELGVDSEQFWGNIAFIGVTFGFKYIYGDSMPDFYIAGIEDKPFGWYPDDGIYATDYYNKETGEKGRIIYGTNLKLIGSSCRNTAFAMDTEDAIKNLAGPENSLASASADFTDLSVKPLVTAVNDNEYSLNVEDRQAILMELDYEGDRPSIKVLRPNGSEYKLIEDTKNGNMHYQTIEAENSESGETEKKIWISVVEPGDGSWRVISDKPLKSVNLYDVKMAPTLTETTAQKLSTDTVRVDWKGEYLEGAKVNLFLTEEGSSEAGRLMEKDMDAVSGAHTLKLPEDVRTGKYVIRVELAKEDYGFTNMSTNSFNVTDIKAPHAPVDLLVEPGGNGLFRVSWKEGENNTYKPDGYVIKALDENGNPLEDVPEAYVDKNTTGTLYGGKVVSLDGTAVELKPDKSYMIMVTAHREDDLEEEEKIRKQHYSKPVVSPVVYLPEPNPPELLIKVNQGEKTIPVQTGEKGCSKYCASDNDVTVYVESEQDITSEVLLNDDVSYGSPEKEMKHEFDLPLREGENKVILRGYNNMGDSSEKTILIYVDSKPPVLKIEGIKTRQQDCRVLIDIKGVCEQGCSLTVNGDNTRMNTEGVFNYTLFMADEMSTDIIVTAADDSGNFTSYRTTVYNDTLKDIRNVYISPGYPSLLDGESMNLTLVAVDSEGKHIAVDNDEVKWSLMVDTDTVKLSDNGTIKAKKLGKAYVKAEFKVNSDFAFTDAVCITVQKKRNLEPNVLNIPAGKVPVKEISVKEVRDVLELIVDMEKNYQSIIKSSLPSDKASVLDVIRMLTISIPEGTLYSAADLTVDAVPFENELMDMFPGMKLLSSIFDIHVSEDTVFKKPVKLGFRFVPSMVDDIRRVAVYRLDEQTGRWIYIGGKPVFGTSGTLISDDKADRMIVELSNFSKYAVIQNNNLRLYEDIAERWSRDAIYSLGHMGAIDGIEIDGSYCFKPQRPITRAEFIKTLIAALGIKTEEDYNHENHNDILSLAFSDSKDIPDWAQEYIKAAYSFKWVDGRIHDGETRIDANKYITREEMFAVLGRSMGELEHPRHLYFNDRNNVARYAVKAMDILAEMGIIVGYPDNTVRPKNLVTREEAAAIIDRYIKLK